MNIFIAIVSRSGSSSVFCADSIIKNTHHLRDIGHNVSIYYHVGNIYIDVARNICVQKFLETDCSDFVFIDDDVAFDDDAISKLLLYDKDIIAGVYPFKQDSLEFPAHIKFDDITNNCMEESTGLVTATMVPTGFMRIKRAALEKIVNYYNLKKDKNGKYHFFKTGVLFENDDRWYGEDPYFCKQWVAMGGELFIVPDINFVHTGIKHFTGNFHNYLSERALQDNSCKWTSDSELNVLGLLASNCESVAEIGSWKGRSTNKLLKSCKGKVYAIDHWKGTETDISGILALKEDVYKQFIENVGSRDNLIIMKEDSLSAANRFNGDRVDMVFIDADHTYEGCKKDIEAWLPKCNKYICGHDYNWPGVKRAVEEKFDNINLVESLWWVRL